MYKQQTKILLVTEGAKGEVELVEKLFSEYELKVDRKIYVYGTNIHELYERVFKNNENDMENIDFLQKLKEKEPNNPVLGERFSDIILIFDYDPQDNRFSEDRIKIMLDYFSESTENGKLYINYPMLESYKHYKAYPDLEYKERKIDYQTLAQGKYKEIVGKEAKITSIRKFSKVIFNEIIKSNIKKENYILKGDYEFDDLKNKYFSIDNKQILEKQSEMLRKNKELYVLNTCIFFICDYNFNLIF